MSKLNRYHFSSIKVKRNLQLVRYFWCDYTLLLDVLFEHLLMWELSHCLPAKANLNIGGLQSVGLSLMFDINFFFKLYLTAYIKIRVWNLAISACTSKNQLVDHDSQKKDWRDLVRGTDSERWNFHSMKKKLVCWEITV